MADAAPKETPVTAVTVEALVSAECWIPPRDCPTSAVCTPERDGRD